MANRLEPLDLVDFTGGLNLRTNQFQLADNESPDMLNVDIDPRGGFYTRKGWKRWNEDDIEADINVPWKPRNAYVQFLGTGTQKIYVVNDTKIYAANDDAVFTPLAVPPPNAHHIGADFAMWGDELYICLGEGTASYHRAEDGTLTAMASDVWSEIDTPVDGTVPSACFIETHGSYMWTACVTEADGMHMNRIRWSHPDKPDSWRADDYLDLDLGGGRITGIISFQDHLLVFKTHSVHAIYGYDEDSWQRILVSDRVGCPAQTAVTRSSSAVYFYSTFEGGGIFSYSGQGPPSSISEQLKPAFEQVFASPNVFVSWAASRLWVGVPWHKTFGSLPDTTTLFVFDPDIGPGAWTMYRNDNGAVATVLDGFDSVGRYPLANFWSSTVSRMVTLDSIDDAYDLLLYPFVIGVTPGTDIDGLPDYLVTGDDEAIEATVVGGLGEKFDSYYRTRWLHGGWPDRRKSWRRPTFVTREVSARIDLLVEVFRDYNETTLYRSRVLHLRPEGGAYWTEGGYDPADSSDSPGFDWKVDGAVSADGRGADWGSVESGSNLVRAGSIGSAKSIQMRVRASDVYPRHKWGVDAVVAKMVMRRFR